jgi:uncharacterized protein (TIGR04222 family)
MDQPWGLSGPQFLGIYAAAIVAQIIIVVLFRRAVRRVPGSPAALTLSPYDVGYLQGGSNRAAEVVIAGLAGIGALRVDSTGKISEAGPGARSGPFADCFGRAWPDGMAPGGETTAAVRKRLSSDPRITGIEERLRARSLMVSRSRVRAARITALVLTAALLGTGIARIVEGAGNHRPVGGLVILVILAGLAGLAELMHMAGDSDEKTTLGARYLSERPWSAPHGALVQGGVQPAGAGYAGIGGAAAAAGSAALFGVALAGFSAVDDESLRTALIAGIPVSASSSSCGGGGCGGCGGGCGGCGGGCGG